MTLPLLIAVTIGLVWLLAVGAAQVRAVDAARETARAVARGDDARRRVARGERVAPPGSAVTRRHDAGRRGHRGRRGRVPGPGGLFDAARRRCRPRRWRRARRPRREVSRGERGSATPFAIACLGLLVLLARRARRRGGDGPRAAPGPVGRRPGALWRRRRRGRAVRDGCAAGGRVAAANGASVTACRVTGRRWCSAVEVDGPRWLGQAGDLTARGPGRTRPDGVSPCGRRSCRRGDARPRACRASRTGR